MVCIHGDNVILLRISSKNVVPFTIYHRSRAIDSDPTTTNDVVSEVRNLLYHDIYYLDMEYDRGFIDGYYQETYQKERDWAAIRPFMSGLGATMLGIGAYTGHPSMMYWGGDLVVSSVTGQGIMDHFLKGIPMPAANQLTGGAAFDEGFIQSFSYMHLVSDKMSDLIISEIMSEVMSMGLNGVVGAIARRVNMGGRLAEHYFLGRLRYLTGEKLGEEVLTGISDRTRAGLLVLHMVRESAELFGEVIFELAFDLMLASDDSIEGWGGGKAFLLVMMASMVTTTVLSESTFGLTMMKSIDWGSWQGKARVGLQVGAIALALSQVALWYALMGGSGA